MPTNYDQKRRIGSIIRESGAIVTFIQDGELFQRTAHYQSNTSSLTALSRTLGVPLGINVLAKLRVSGDFSLADNGVLFSDLAMADVAPSATGAPGLSAPSLDRSWVELSVRTNTSAQIRERSNEASRTVEIVTEGWFDRRGRNG